MIVVVAVIDAMRVVFYISGFGYPSVAICQLTALSQSLTFLRLYILRTFWHTSAICVVYSNLKDSFRPKNLMKLWICLWDYYLQLSQQQCIDELNSIFGDEARSRTSVYRWYGKWSRLGLVCWLVGSVLAY